MQRSLDGFTVIELVGFGATGEVWRARPDDAGPEVALKWLADDAIDTDTLSRSGLPEFDHPHVARLLDVRRDGATVVLVQEFVSGVSLAALLAERQRLSGAEVVTLLTPVAEALGKAHEADLLHGNLTPSAILVTADGRPMLTELGLRQSLTGTAAGPPHLDYLDPVVARGEAPTQASDVFGLAALGFHALTGRPPWSDRGDVDAWEIAADGRGVDLGDLRAGPNSRLADVIARGLSQWPHARGSARDFAVDVRAALEPEPLHLAGPYVWPDLPTPAPADTAELNSVRRATGGLDIASEVRRGAAARHAAAPGARRERGPRGPAGTDLGCSRGWKLRSAARVVPRRAVIAACVVLAVLSVIVLGLGWNSSRVVPARAGAPIAAGSAVAGAGEANAQPDTGIEELTVPDSPQAWVELLNVLYERRALAFATGAFDLLDQVFTADSPQLLADTSELDRLVEAGQVLRGFAPHVLEVLDAVVDGHDASLQITDEFASYETVPAADTGAAALADHAGRAPAPVAMTLVLTEQGWRISSAARLA